MTEATLTLVKKGQVSLLQMKSTYSHLNLGKCALEIRKKKAEEDRGDRDQRLMVSAEDPKGQVHELEGHRQVVNNTLGRYFILEKSSEGSFTAHPVKNWVLLEPCLKYKTLNDDEADVEFEKRDKTLNHFSIMIQKRLRSKDGSDEEEIQPVVKKPCLKEAKLDDSWISDEDEIKPESEEDDKCVLSD